MHLAITVFGALAVLLFLNGHDVAGVILAGIAGVLVFVQIAKRRAREAIAREIQKEPVETSSPAPYAVQPKSSLRAPAAPERVESPLPFTIEVVELADLPDASAETRARFETVRARGVELRRLYRRAVLLLALASTLLAFVLFRISPDLNFFYFDAAFLAITIVILSCDAARWGSVERRWDTPAKPPSLARRALEALRIAAIVLTLGLVLVATRAVRAIVTSLREARGGAAADRSQWESEVVPLRPVVIPLLGGLWLTVMCICTVFLFVPVAVVYVIVLRRKKAELERRYPVDPPLVLLTLRVFSSPSAREFILLTDRWRWVGPLQRLDGPDTAGGSLRDVVAYLLGRVENVIVESDGELAKARARFDTAPDRQLRYSLNSIQSNDATWKLALKQLLDEADAVVMDLSGFDGQRRGCAYEIGKLLDQVPFDRFVLLVNDETDMAFLTHTLHEAWLSMPEGSPNRTAGDRPILMLNLAGTDGLGPSEMFSAWRARVRKRIDSERLVGVLLDAAGSGRNPQRAEVHHWAQVFSFL